MFEREYVYVLYLILRDDYSKIRVKLHKGSEVREEINDQLPFIVKESCDT